MRPHLQAVPAIVLLWLSMPALAQRPLPAPAPIHQPAKTLSTLPGTVRTLQREHDDVLRCQSGPVKMIAFTQEGASGSLLRVEFTKTTTPSSGGIKPGACAWKNAVMVADDPSFLCQKVDHVFLTTGYIGGIFSNTPDAWVVQAAWSRSAPWLKQIHERGKTLSFRVRKDPSLDCLMVESQI